MSPRSYAGASETARVRHHVVTNHAARGQKCRAADLTWRTSRADSHVRWDRPLPIRAPVELQARPGCGLRDAAESSAGDCLLNRANLVAGQQASTTTAAAGETTRAVTVRGYVGRVAIEPEGREDYLESTRQSEQPVPAPSRSASATWDWLGCRASTRLFVLLVGVPGEASPVGDLFLAEARALPQSSKRGREALRVLAPLLLSGFVPTGHLLRVINGTNLDGLTCMASSTRPYKGVHSVSPGAGPPTDSWSSWVMVELEVIQLSIATRKGSVG